MEEAIESQKVVVVGMNRPRLNKILSLIEEQRANASNDLTKTSQLEVELIPALAALGSYEGEDCTTKDSSGERYRKPWLWVYPKAYEAIIDKVHRRF